jgi:hypothetical protein
VVKSSIKPCTTKFHQLLGVLPLPITADCLKRAVEIVAGGRRRQEDTEETEPLLKYRVALLEVEEEGDPTFCSTSPRVALLVSTSRKSGVFEQT